MELIGSALVHFDAVRALLSRCSGDNWAQVAERFNREMHWEFETYRE